MPNFFLSSLNLAVSRGLVKHIWCITLLVYCGVTQVALPLRGCKGAEQRRADQSSSCERALHAASRNQSCIARCAEATCQSGNYERAELGCKTDAQSVSSDMKLLHPNFAASAIDSVYSLFKQ